MKKLYRALLSLFLVGLMLLPVSADLYIPPQEEISPFQNIPLLVGSILLLVLAAAAVIFLISRKKKK